MLKQSKHSGVKRAGVAVLAALMALTMGNWFQLQWDSAATAKSETQKKLEQQFPSLTRSGSSKHTLSKEETTYAVLDAEGTEKTVVVNEWLKNGTEDETIQDTSTLRKIKNTAGNETYQKSGTHLKWNAAGKDIHYQGTTEEELPVSVKVTYYLDGSQIRLNALKGRSGHVKIRFDYTVRRTDTVNTGGSSYSITHPYTIASGLLLDGSNFSNVTVSSGKAVNDGNTNLVLGVAFPGLGQDLGLDGKIDIPEHVTVEADTTNFKMDGTYTVAMSGILGELDLDSTDGIKSQLSSLEKGLTQLSSSSKQLVSGTKQVNSATHKVASGSSTLEKGTGTLANGTQQLASGAGKLASGAGKLNQALNQFKIPSVSLTNQQKKKIQSSAAKNQKVKSAANQLSSGIGAGVASSMKSQLTSDTTKNALKSGLKSQLKAGVSGNSTLIGSVTESLQKMGLDEATASAAAKQLVATIGDGVVDTAVDASVDTTLNTAASNITGDAISNRISGSVSSVMGQVAGQSAVSGGEAVASTVNSKLGSYKGKVSSLKGAVSQLSSGTSSLSGGAGRVNGGVSKIENGAKQLASGTKKLAAGTSTLADGMVKFDRQGIQKLVGSLDQKELKTIGDRFDALVRASRDEVFLGGKESGMEGTSKIIFKTKEIE